mgnify:CR=1 FL=1
MSRSARLPGSAHAGLVSWLLQRGTAIYLGGFVVYVVARLAISPIRDHAAWQAWFASGGVRLAWALAIGSLLVHAWIGMRSVYLDYLHALWLRFTVSFLTALGLIAAGLWAVDILLHAGVR